MTRAQKAIAYHEAGHAVAAWAMDLPFKHVTVDKSEDSLGHVLMAKHPKWFQPDIDRSARSRAWAERCVMVDFAGRIAEKRFRGKHQGFGHDSDNQHAVDIAFRFFRSRETVEAFLKLCLHQCRDLLNENWWAVQAVAEALLIHKQLTYRATVAAIVEASRTQFEMRRAEICPSLSKAEKTAEESADQMADA